MKSYCFRKQIIVFSKQIMQKYEKLEKIGEGNIF